MASVRPDGSKSAISELWLDGEMVSRAELTRSRMNHSAEKDLKQAVKEQSQAGFDAGHWYWQPVGARAFCGEDMGPLLKFFLHPHLPPPTHHSQELHPLNLRDSPHAAPKRSDGSNGGSNESSALLRLELHVILACRYEGWEAGVPLRAPARVAGARVAFIAVVT